MKLWKAILLVFLIMFLIGSLSEVSSELAAFFWFLFVIVTSIWIYIDAKKLDVEKYKSFYAMPPILLATWTWPFWFITLIGYLNLKYKIKSQAAPSPFFQR